MPLHLVLIISGWLYSEKDRVGVELGRSIIFMNGARPGGYIMVNSLIVTKSMTESFEAQRLNNEDATVAACMAAIAACLQTQRRSESGPRSGSLKRWRAASLLEGARAGLAKARVPAGWRTWKAALSIAVIAQLGLSVSNLSPGACAESVSDFAGAGMPASSRSASQRLGFYGSQLPDPTGSSCQEASSIAGGSSVSIEQADRFAGV